MVKAYLAKGGRYYEPFLGGGAVFFYLRPQLATLSDINRDLINVYQVVRDTPKELIHAVRRIPVRADEYYRLRKSQPRTPLNAAARFLYLNRTAFGGIYRLNRKGHFNVPFGGGDRTPAPLWEDQLIERASTLLRKVRIKPSDFASLMRQAEVGDVIYCDPTYTVAHDSNGFVRYNERNFSWADQVRLAEEAHFAAQRGVTVLVSNAHNDLLRKLYPQAHVEVLTRTSRVSVQLNGRKKVAEYFFTLTRRSHSRPHSKPR